MGLQLIIRFLIFPLEHLQFLRTYRYQIHYNILSEQKGNFRFQNSQIPRNHYYKNRNR